MKGGGENWKGSRSLPGLKGGDASPGCGAARMRVLGEERGLPGLPGTDESLPAP